MESRLSNMSVRLFIAATLRRFFKDYNPEEGITLEIGEGESVLSLARRIGIPIEEIKIVMINGTHGSLDTLLKDRDRVALFPPVGGG